MIRPAHSLANGLLAWGLIAVPCLQPASCDELPAAVRALPLDTRVMQLAPVNEQKSPPVVTALRLHPNGRTLVAAGDDHRIRLIEIETGRTLRVFPGHEDWVDTAVFSPDGQRLITAGLDHRVICWPLSGSEEGWQIGPLPGAIAEIQFNHQGTQIAIVGFGHPLQIVDAVNGQLIRKLECPCRDMRSVAFSPDDGLLAGAGRNGRVRIWNVSTGQIDRTFAAHRKRVRAVQFAEDGQQLLTASEDRTVRCWNLQDGSELFALEGVPGKVLAMTVLPGQRLATACSDNVIRIWDLRDRSLLSQLKGHTGSVAVLDANDQWLVSGAFDTTIRLWPLHAMDRAIVALKQQHTITDETEEQAGNTTQPTSLKAESDQ